MWILDRLEIARQRAYISDVQVNCTGRLTGLVDLCMQGGCVDESPGCAPEPMHGEISWRVCKFSVFLQTNC